MEKTLTHNGSMFHNLYCARTFTTKVTAKLTVPLLTLSVIGLVPGLLFFVQNLLGMDAAPLHVTAQEDTTTTNMSQENSASPENQSSSGDTTTDVADLRPTLTRQDLQPVLDNLFNAREHLLGDNITGSFNAVSLASGALFKLNSSLAASSPAESEISLSPLQRQIESARSSLLNQNSTLAIKYLNNADIQFILLSQELSGGNVKDNRTR